MERGGQPGPLRARQVSLHVKRRLELKDLRSREDGPCLLLASALIGTGTVAASATRRVLLPVYRHATVSVGCARIGHGPVLHVHVNVGIGV